MPVRIHYLIFIVQQFQKLKNRDLEQRNRDLASENSELQEQVDYVSHC